MNERVMNLQWILHPATYYSLTAFGTALGLYLFVTLKLEGRRREIRAANKERELTAAMQQLQGAIEALRFDLRTVEVQTGMLAPPRPPRSGMNIGSRTRAVKMQRHGQTAAQIAAELGLPLKEVELLLKVHQIVVKQL